MATATPSLFNSFKERKNEDMNLGSDSFVVFLTNTLPVATNTVIADITQVTYTNLSSRTLTTASSAQTGGTYALDFNDLTLTSTGGTTGPFRYVGIFNDTLAGDPLVCWADYGSSITLGDGESIDIVFNASGLFTET